MGAKDIQLNKWAQAPIRLGSGKKPLSLTYLDLSYNWGKNSHVLPLAL